MNIENYIESQYRSLYNNTNEEYLDLYEGVNHSKLKIIFSTLHSRFTELFKSMNSRLPTGSEYSAHFWAEPSRELIECIEITEGLQRVLKNTIFAFNLDEYYQGVIEMCNTFLSASGGSVLPPGMNKVDLYYGLTPWFWTKPNKFLIFLRIRPLFEYQLGSLQNEDYKIHLVR